LTIGLAGATAAMSEHPSTAAILTLSVTVGTWIINFVAAVEGGLWERAAGYTPTAIVGEFQHGLLRLDVVLVALALTACGLGLATIWFRVGVRVRRRAFESAALGVATILAIMICAAFRPSWDMSESRANSFPEADEAALRRIGARLTIEAHLAPEDPRRFDLERQALRKLRRVLPHVDVRYLSATSIGLFEQSNPHYGEIWYELGGHRAMSRVTTADGVLEAIYGLAGIAPRAEGNEKVFRGHPLAVAPRYAAAAFYGAWPAMVAAAAIFIRRRQR